MDPPPLESQGSSSWSKLPLDLLHSVFERLGFADFQQAKSVCSSWEYASRQSAPNNQHPWLIQFPEKGNDYCLLFNPEEKDKMYKVQDLGVNFANSHCLATSGSWLLMQDHYYNLYIFNLLTRERIDMPSLESQLCMIEIQRTSDDMFVIKLRDTDIELHDNHLNIESPLLWVDQKTKDYVVMWIIQCRDLVLVHSRNGDNFWKQTKLFSCIDMVYKDHKLYVGENHPRDVQIIDFLGDSQRQILKTQVKRRRFKMPRLYHPERGDVWNINKDHLVVTVTGEILRVESIVRSNSDVWSFHIYKMDLSKSEWEKLSSLGDEAIILDLGVTVLANTIKCINRNSIYFSGDHRLRYTKTARVWSEEDIFIFDLDTHMVKRPHRSMCSSIQSSDARWFVPNFQRK